MKALIIGETPELPAFGEGEVPSTYACAYQCPEAVAANLANSTLEAVCEFLPFEDLQETSKMLSAKIREEFHL